MTISRLLHAGYLFEYQGVRVLFDPLFESPFSHNCYAFPAVEFDKTKLKKQKFDAVFISHYHDDHCSLVSLNELDRTTPIYMYCVFEEIFSMIRELGFKNVYSLKLNSSILVGGIKITPRRALDADVDSLFHIETGGLHVLNVVDSWIDPETLELLAQTKWDLILWPFQTMRELEVISPRRARPPEIPYEWTEQIQKLAPKNLVPSSCQFQMESWSWYNKAFFPIRYQDFQNYLKKIQPETKYLELNPGCTVSLAGSEVKFLERLDFIVPKGPQDLDYDYQPHFIPPSTSEVARHFEALTTKENDEITAFCEKKMMEVYQQLEPSEESYFQRSLIWKLSLYDHSGLASHYYYQLQENRMILQNQVAEDQHVGWFTEIPRAKLYGALKNGESLTSMYVRINDREFPKDIEDKIQHVDLIEDPLLRCLFNKEFGSYQKAQLKRIKES